MHCLFHRINSLRCPLLWFPLWVLLLQSCTSLQTHTQDCRPSLDLSNLMTPTGRELLTTGRLPEISFTINCTTTEGQT